MTLPEVNQELERLFSAAREATLPDTDACTRIRAGIDVRLAAGADSAAGQASNRRWLATGGAVIGVGIVGLWLTSTAHGPTPPVPASSAPIVAPSRVTGQPVALLPALAVPATMAEAAAPSKAAEVGSSAKRSQPATSAQPPAPSSAATDSAEELTLVRAMQQALRAGDSSRALSLAAEHARRFPEGALVEEREGARAIASCQRAAAEARTTILATFMGRFGGSPYAARVKAACQ